MKIRPAVIISIREVRNVLYGTLISVRIFSGDRNNSVRIFPGDRNNYV